MRPGIRAHAKQNVRGKERSEEHHFRSKEEPDADLRVEQAGIGPGFYRVGNFHADQAFLNCSGSFCGVKSVACPGTLYSYGPRWTSIGLVKFPCCGERCGGHSLGFPVPRVWRASVRRFFLPMYIVIVYSNFATHSKQITAD